MPALTFLGKDLKISLAHSTITFYPVDGHNFYNDLNQYLIDNRNKETDISRFIHRNDVDHDFYHDDSFYLEEDHSHATISNGINKEKLEHLMDFVLNKGYIDQTEKTHFLNAYIQASAHVFDEIDAKLADLKEKTEFLATTAKTDKSYQAAADASSILYTKLSHEVYAYKLHRTPEAYNEFKLNCTQAINNAQEELSKHRGWKEVLFNVSAAVLGLGVFYLVAAAINYRVTNGHHFFFHVNTDSETKLNEFKEVQSSLLRL